jgi:ribose transport system substrate-binding protein
MAAGCWERPDPQRKDRTIHRLPTHRRRRAFAAGAAVTLAAVTMLASACSSSSGTNSAGAGSATTSGSAPAASSPASSTPSSGGVTAGVPTLAQLYRGLGDPPPTTGPTPPKHQTVWWVSCGQQIPACSTGTTYARQAASMLGWTLKVADADLGLNGGFLTAMRQAIAAKPDAIIDEAIDCSLIEQPLKEAKAAGIPVVAFQANDCNSPVGGNGGPALFSGPTKYSSSAPTSGDLSVSTGTVGAEYVIDKTGGHAKIIDTVLQDPLILAIDAGFRAEIKKCPGCSIVGTVTAGVADVTPGGPFSQELQAALVKYPDANVVYMPLDSELESGGGAEIVKESGRNILVVGGQGYDPAVVNLTKSGVISAMTSVVPAQWAAYGVMDTVVRVLAKVPTVDEGIGVNVADPQHGIGPNNTVSAPFDIQAAYAKLWGVGA